MLLSHARQATSQARFMTTSANSGLCSLFSLVHLRLQIDVHTNIFKILKYNVLIGANVSCLVQILSHLMEICPIRTQSMTPI